MRKNDDDDAILNLKIRKAATYISNNAPNLNHVPSPSLVTTQNI